MVKLGAHQSIAGGVDRALERAASIGCEAVQMFLKNNMQWRGPALATEEIAGFHHRHRALGDGAVFAHSSYLINLASLNPRVLRPSIAAVRDEIERADALGIPFIVMHPGAHLGAGERAGLARIARSLDQIFRGTDGSRVRLALETTAGQGTNLGYRFEHLAEIRSQVEAPSRVAVCVDTCHLFAAGYDFRTRRGYDQTWRELEREIGTSSVVAFHLNDSKTPLGSRVDRHEHIGHGQIGAAAFRRLLRDPRWDGLPMVLETPKGKDLREDVENLRLLRELRG